MCTIPRRPRIIVDITHILRQLIGLSHVRIRPVILCEPTYMVLRLNQPQLRRMECQAGWAYFHFHDLTRCGNLGEY